MAAQYFKYLLLQCNPYAKYKLPLHKVPYKSLYNRNKNYFDKFAEVFQKYNINAEKYIYFFIIEFGKREKDIPQFFLSTFTISKFAEHMQIRRQYFKIYKYFLKSVDNIIEECIKNNFTSTREYLRSLIVNGKLANEYVAGRISCYYLCALHNFKKIIPKMDVVSQQEFSKILIRYDKYNTDVQNAFMLYKSQRVNPLKFTDERLLEKIRENNKTKTNNNK